MISSRGARLVALGLALAGLTVAPAPGAFALNPSLDVSQYAHTSWKARDAFGGGRIEAITQTTDGYLWIGTDLGLFRFDGVTMVRWPPSPSATAMTISMVWGLLGARDGTLWISADDGVMTLKNGKTAVIPTPRGRRFSTILEDRDGQIWLGPLPPELLLCRVVKGAVDCSELPVTYGPPTGVLFEDSAGSVWTGFDRCIVRLKPDPRQWFPQPSQLNGYKGLVEDDGALLVGVPAGMARLVKGKTDLMYPAPPAVTPLPPVAVLRDRDGGLWMATYGRGIWHVHDGRTDVFTAADGLSGDGANLLFEDREGSIWVTTDDGLDRFHDVSMPNIAAARTFSNGTVATVMAATDGSLWVATLDGLNHRDGDRLTVYRERNRPARPGSRQVVAPGFPERSQSLFQDRAGRIWVSDRRAVGYLDGDRFVPVLDHADVLVLFIVEDAQGDIWVSTRNQLARVRGDRVREAPRWSELGVSHATAAIVDPGGGLWLGLNDGGVVYYRNHSVEQRYSAADGVGAGRVNHFRADGDGAIWAATEGGLSRIKAGRVSTLNAAGGLPCDAVHWSTTDASGSVWLYTPCGLLRVPRDDLDAWAVGADDDRLVRPRVGFTLFDSADGVRLLARPNRYHPQVTTAPDGRIWFSTLDGVAVIDARNIRVNALAPPVHIERVIADRTLYDATSGLRLPPLVRNLQIDYNALSLVVPQKNRFRVMLEGRDRDWHDVGTRREAFYTDLAPGSYRFRVIASNNSGVWNEEGAELDFTIEPAYYQTIWFRALAAAALAALLWAAYRLRVRVIERHSAQMDAFNEQLMKAQEQERTRIAGDLHDSVMQQITALSLVLGTAKRKMPADSEARDMVVEVQRKLIDVGSEVRQLSHDLYPPMLQEAGLAEVLRGYCEAFGRSRGIPVWCDIEESVAELSPGTALALYRIAQEALGNAAKHAAPTRVDLRLQRMGGEVVLTVADDGQGCEPGRVTDGGVGLVNMRERARQLGGTFELDSRPRHGTTLRVAVPFRIREAKPLELAHK